MEILDKPWWFSKKNGDLAIKNGDLAIKNGDLAIKNGDLAKKKWWFSIVM